MLLASCYFPPLSTHGRPFSPSPMAWPHSSTQQLQDQIHSLIHYSMHLCFSASRSTTWPPLSWDHRPHLSLLETATSTFHYASPQWNSSWNHHWYVLITLHSSSYLLLPFPHISNSSVYQISSLPLASPETSPTNLLLGFGLLLSRIWTTATTHFPCLNALPVKGM